MSVLIAAFVVSTLATLLLVRSAKMHARHTADRDFSKPQGFHETAVPRIGGAAIALALLAGALPVGYVLGDEPRRFYAVLLACALPAFLGGFIQDFTEAITPRGRLVATAISAALAFALLDAGVDRADLWGFDWIAGFTLGSLMLTMLAAGGIAHAVNIIDGFNGLASMCVAIMLGAIAYVAFQLGDELVALMALAGIGAALGFFVWNFPHGLIFMGDGGAYLLGFYVAELGILLLARHPQLSPMFPLLVCIYPVFETLFSVYRRRVLRASSPSMPDGIHLHSLIYRRVIRWALNDRQETSAVRSNSMTSPYLWVLCSASVLPAVLFWDKPALLKLSVLAFGTCYVVLYWRIVRFRAPRWMRAVADQRRWLGRGENNPR